MADRLPALPDGDPEGLGLTAEDLADFEPPGKEGETELGDQESTLEGEPAPDPDHPPVPADAGQPEEQGGPAERGPEAPTPHAQAEAAARQPSGSSTEEPPQPPAPAVTPPAEAGTPAPKATDQPWTFAADGRRVSLEGAVVDAEGNVRIPAKALPQLQRHLADRQVWQERELAYRDTIRSLDPANNRQVLLSRLIAEEMEAASDPAKGGSADKLYDWCAGFIERLPQLRGQAEAAAIQAENARLRERLEPYDRARETERTDPIIRDGIADYLEQFLAQPEWADLASERSDLAARLWELHQAGELVAVAEHDDPQQGLQRGQLYLKLPVIQRELAFAQRLLKRRTQQAQEAAQRTAAAGRNKAALEPPADVPPVPSASGGRVSDPGATGGSRRPKSREEWREGLHDLAEGRRAL